MTKFGIMKLLGLGSVTVLLSIVAQASAESFETTSGNSKIRIFPGKPSQYFIDNTSQWADYIRIVGRTHSDTNCKTDGQSLFALVLPPIHGAVCTRLEDGHSKFNNDGKAPRCLGQPGKFVVLYYRPVSGFVGTDQFEFTIKFGDEAINTKAVVRMEILPPDSAIPIIKNLPGNGLQSTGEVPACPPLTM